MTSLEFRDVMLSYLLRDMDTYTLNGARRPPRRRDPKASLFDTWEWNFGRDPKFNVTREGRFAGGKLTARAFVENGHASQTSTSTGDFFAKEGLEQLAKPRSLAAATRRRQSAPHLPRRCAQDYFYQITLDEILSCII